jgi:hypothetical protein
MLKRLNDIINPVLCDMDPDECVEEPYKNKNNQVFSWKFLRGIMSMIPIRMMNIKETSFLMLRSEIEEIATLVHAQAMKRSVIQEKYDEEENGDDEFAKFMAIKNFDA